MEPSPLEPAAATHLDTTPEGGPLHLRPNMSDNVAQKLSEMQIFASRDGTRNTNPTIKQSNVSHLSSKQVFLPISCLPYENNIVYCYILSAWDNIIGPQTVQIWKRELNRCKKTHNTVIESKNVNVDPKPLINSCVNSAEGRQTNEIHSTSKSSFVNLPNNQISDCAKENIPAIDKYVKQSSQFLNRPVTHKILRCSEAENQGSHTQSKEDLQDLNCTPPETNVGCTSASNCSKQLPKRQGGVGRLHGIAQYVTEHTVSLGQHHLTPALLLMLPYHQLMVQTVRLVVTEEGSLVPYALSMVVPLQEEQQLLQVLPLTGAYLQRAARLLHALLEKRPLSTVGRSLAPPLTELCRVLVSLRRGSLARYPLLPSAQPPPDSMLALTLLTSHLQTSGYTVLTADSSTAVNKVLLWLGLFVPPEQLHLARLCQDPQHDTLQPGLIIQGVVSSSPGSSISGESLLQFGRPVTLCDLTARTVMQTILPPAESGVHTATSEVVRSVSAASGLVRRLLRDLELLVGHSAEVRTGYITAFVRSLRYQALALISWLHHNRSEGRGTKASAALKEVFGVDDASLAILLAQAETLQPGTTRLL